MKGFIIRHQEKEVTASLVQGNIAVILSIVQENMTINCSGIKKHSFEYIIWYNSKLRKGDKIIVRIAEVEENSGAMKIRPMNREEMLREYIELKAQLKNEGLI